MRPVRIELEGFSAYRERVQVDFDGVDFFSLAGPTGSGKSSLLDAMIFALYGRVPRLGGNAVAPVISAGADRARIRFFFEVDGVRYDATRLAQRTKTGGANVRESRLQQDDRVLAEGPGDVTEEVEAILRLSFEDFTRTVVLPQGDFARFLRATKSERQSLLRNLLGLDVYTRMRELARTREAVAKERAENAIRLLGDLEVPDEETRRRGIARCEALEEFAATLPQREGRLDELRVSLESAISSLESFESARGRLADIEAPARLEELESITAGARSALVDGKERAQIAKTEAQDLERSVAALPTADQISSWRRAQTRLAEFESLLANNEIDEARERVAQVDRELADGQSSLDAARASVVQARTDHSAHLLAETLETGESCPVCRQTVADLPPLDSLPVIGELESAEERLENEVSASRQRAQKAHTHLAGVEANRAAVQKQKDELVAELANIDGDLDSIETEVNKAVLELERARSASSRAEAAVEEAERDLEALAESSRLVSKKLTTAQLSVADLDPPVSEADDVIVQWKELVYWRDMTLGSVMESLESAKAGAADAALRLEEEERGLAAALVSLGIEPIQPYAVQVATELQVSRATVEAQESALRTSTRLQDDIDSSSSEAAVAGALANHLKANGFEQWLMSGALGELVTGANSLLEQLSGGGYSLHSDDSGSFSIVDHLNADEIRRVETLSGGETFLVSLALALSLAETLAAKGGSGLDAIILDEGFGTLDEETLETVASVLEELSGRGLMVGVITHVKELAARAPVRYEVTRSPGGAQVEVAT